MFYNICFSIKNILFFSKKTFINDSDPYLQLHPIILADDGFKYIAKN